MGKVNLKVGDVVFLKSDIKKKHPLTINRLEDDDDINDWEIWCSGITSEGKTEFHSFNSPNMLKKKKQKKKKKALN